MEPVSFVTEDGVRLQGELRLPDGPARATAVLCHPHPKHGGSKDHPILWALRNHLAGVRDIAVLSFNFRGVMGSAGVYGGGHDEVRDVRAAIDRVREVAPDRPTVVVGWSFGANVGAAHLPGPAGDRGPGDDRHPAATEGPVVAVPART